MGVRLFITLLLVIAVSLLIATVVFAPIKPSKDTQVPSVTFINSIMYDINNNEVTQLVKSKKAYHYDKKDELYDATVILKAKDENKSKLISDTVSAKFIEITNDLIKFRGDVNYNRSTGTILQSQSLDYDRISEHLTSNYKFVAFYNGNKLKGNSLSIQKGQMVFKTKDNSPVKLDVIMNENKGNK